MKFFPDFIRINKKLAKDYE